MAGVFFESIKKIGVVESVSICFINSPQVWVHIKGLYSKPGDSCCFLLYIIKAHCVLVLWFLLLRFWDILLKHTHTKKRRIEARGRNKKGTRTYS